MTASVADEQTSTGWLSYVLLLESKLAYLWFHKYQINEQDHKVVLDILVRKTLATGTLRQPYVSTRSSVCSPDFDFWKLWHIGEGLLWA